MVRSPLIFLLGAMLASCGSSDASVIEAVKRRWPAEQTVAADRAAFYVRGAEAFEDGARLSARMDAAFGRRSGPADLTGSSRGVARENRERQVSYEKLSKSSISSIENIRCAKAAPLPGENCEMDLTLKAADGAVFKSGGAWRLDTVDGRLTVIDGAQ